MLLSGIIWASYQTWPKRQCKRNTLDCDLAIVVLIGVKVTDFKEGDPVPPRKFDFEPYNGTRPEYGYISMQNHGDHDVVFFKEIAVKSLEKEAK